MAEVLFWISLIAVFYIYIGYPVAAGLTSMVLNRRVQKAPHTPFVTVLIAAFNEQDCIEATVRNKLSQDYPADLLEVLVVSDGSTDRTDDIVRSFADHRVKLMRQEPRAGKTSALNLAVVHAKGEIIVFSDANSLYAPDAIRRLMENFADPAVGYATGKMIYAETDGTTIGEGCSAYMKYENRLRQIETRLGAIVGVDGGIDAVRKELYHPMNPDQLPDFVLPLKVLAQNRRVVYEPAAVLWETSLKEAADEYRMRVRVSLRALWALFDMRQLLGFKDNALFAWQLWSHKVLRYLCFLFLIMLAFSNLLILGKNGWYSLFMLIQAAGYLCAAGESWIAQKGFSNSAVRFAHYFVLINIAAAHAFLKFITGQKQVIWTPRKG